MLNVSDSWESFVFFLKITLVGILRLFRLPFAIAVLYVYKNICVSFQYSTQDVMGVKMLISVFGTRLLL